MSTPESTSTHVRQSAPVTLCHSRLYPQVKEDLVSENAQKLLGKVQFLEEETTAQRPGAEDV